MTLLYDKVLDPIKIKKENTKHDKEQLQDLSTVKHHAGMLQTFPYLEKMISWPFACGSGLSQDPGKIKGEQRLLHIKEIPKSEDKLFTNR